MKPEERTKAIEKALQASLSPTQLTVEDEGHLHIGHEGAKTGRGHFHIAIASSQFDGKPSIACHRLIYSALGDLMESDIHAVRISILPPT